MTRSIQITCDECGEKLDAVHLEDEDDALEFEMAFYRNGWVHVIAADPTDDEEEQCMDFCSVTCILDYYETREDGDGNNAFTA